jgi:hypothetical protein
MLFAVCAVASAARAELPQAATLLDPDIIWDPVSVHSAAISPDGKLLAYVSKGAIWVCRVTSGPPTKLIDLPGTITDFLKMPEYQFARDKFSYVTPSRNYTPIRELHNQYLQLYNLQWTPSQDGVTYTLRKKLADNSMLAAYRVVHVSLSGEPTDIALIERKLAATPDSQTSFRVAPDRKHVLVSNFGVPLIWDCVANRPRATCFDFLVPSSTSGRFLGVEIDTRELVLVNEEFQVAKRFGIILDQRRQCDLFWSRDEGVAMCRSFRSSMEPISNHCTAFRVNLKTAECGDTKKGIEGDRYYFSGNGTEAIRVGIVGVPPNGFGDGTYGTYVEIMPDGNDTVQELIRFNNPVGQANEWHRQFYPAVLCNSDCTLFAIALPRRKGTTAGFHFHLMDRSGKTWPFGPQSSQFISPYLPIAFCDGDRVMVAHDGSQLFSIPVESIQANKDEPDE